jgi:serine/threonine-protein kinase haspin
VGVCRGPYAKELAKAWKKWDKAHGSENDDVGGLPPDQLYIVIAMMDSGRDLEKAAMSSFSQARSLLAQVAFTLAVAEEAVEYEHRDM